MAARSKRAAWALKLSVFLVIGLVVTWAGAWALALWGSVPASGYGAAVAPNEWPVKPPDGWPRPTSIDVAYGDGLIERRTVALWRDGDQFHCIVTEAGWPLGAMSGVTFEVRSTALGSSTTERYSFAAPASLAPGRRVPTRVHPFGFAVDAVVAGGVLLGLYEAWRAGVRTWRWEMRVNRGGCEWCGYDLAEVDPKDPCPECGRA